MPDTYIINQLTGLNQSTYWLMSKRVLGLDILSMEMPFYFNIWQKTIHLKQAVFYIPYLSTLDPHLIQFSEQGFGLNFCTPPLIENYYCSCRIFIRTLDSKFAAVIQGHHTNEILTYRGVRQRCILAPLLLNLYINPLVAKINRLEHQPKLTNRHIATLLCTDDTVFQFQMLIGLK